LAVFGAPLLKALEACGVAGGSFKEQGKEQGKEQASTSRAESRKKKGHSFIQRAAVPLLSPRDCARNSGPIFWSGSRAPLLGRPTSAARASLSRTHRSRPVPSQCWPWADQGVPLLRNRAQRTRFGLGASDEAARGGGVILRWSAVHSRWSSRDALVQCDLPSHRRSSSANRAGGERSPAETHRANRSIR